jgi:hypothetical protein
VGPLFAFSSPTINDPNGDGYIAATFTASLASAVPEPASIVMLGTGALAGLGCAVWRRPKGRRSLLDPAHGRRTA